MNSRMLRVQEDKTTKKERVTYEPDRIPGTTKIRTYTANASLYSEESSLDKLIQRAKLCSDTSKQK